MVMPASAITRRRMAWERFVWSLDLAAYAFVGVAGAVVALHPSYNVSSVLGEYPAISAVWSALLVVGGVGGIVGRASRVWAVEFVAAVFAGWGLFLYLIVLLPTIVDGSGIVLASVVFVSWAFVVRRYAELHIFTHEPKTLTTRAWLENAPRLRTLDVVARHRP